MLHKAPAMPTYTSCSAIILFNGDGSVNLLVSGVDYGQGTYTALAQIAADELKLPLEKVRVPWDSDTDFTPYDWQTVASRFTVMGGNAVIEAATDCLDQIRAVAGAGAAACRRRDRVRRRAGLGEGPAGQDARLRKLVLGYTFPDGNSIGGPVIGRGRYIAHGLTNLDPETGQGRPALNWTYGAHGVEIEVDTDTGHIRVLKLVSAFDAGKVINLQQCRTQVVGGVVQGLGSALMEKFVFDRGRLLNNTFTDYKIPTAKDVPLEMKQMFVETPHPEGPYGARGVAEHPMISVPGAIGNALADATGVEFFELPLDPETVYLGLKRAAAERARAAGRRGRSRCPASRLRAGPPGLLPRLRAAHARLAGAEGPAGRRGRGGGDGHAAQPRAAGRAGLRRRGAGRRDAQRPGDRGARRERTRRRRSRPSWSGCSRPGPRPRRATETRPASLAAALQAPPGGQPGADLGARRARRPRGAPRAGAGPARHALLRQRVAGRRGGPQARGGGARAAAHGPRLRHRHPRRRPLAFANAVRRGPIGVVGASGTGIQEITCLVHRLGGGISQAIGTGGRDLSVEVGGLMTLLRHRRAGRRSGDQGPRAWCRSRRRPRWRSR